MTTRLRSGNPEEVAMAAPLVSRAARLAEAWVAEGHTSGLVVLVARRGVVVTHEAFGRLSAEAEAPALPPGVRMRYSNYAYELLGDIVRRVSGKALADFAAERIFRPLEMADTYFVVPEALQCRIARRWSEAELDPTAYAAAYETREYEEAPWAAHGVFSTAMDMAVFGQMFLQHGTVGGARVLGPATVAAMTTNQIPGVGLQFDDEHFAEASWGLGWSVHGSRNARRGGSLYSARAFEHNGLGGTYLWVDPTSDLVGVYFSLLRTGAPGLNGVWHADLFSNVVTAAILYE
jgi:CubicO group peptidase (beta-lactamase class C family)